MRFRIDLKIFLFLALFYITKQIEVYLIVLVFAFIHEIGHLIAGLIVGMRPEKIDIMPSGLGITFKAVPRDYNIKIGKGNLVELKKILVALAGPLTNLFIIFFATKLNMGMYMYILVVFSNFLIFVFNLIPIYPMDRRKDFK